MLDRYLLRYAIAVADHGHFSRAAAACHVTQPTLSAGIAKLERALGARLFERSNRRVALTEAGARLVAQARRIEEGFLAAEGLVPTPRDGATLRLGVLRALPAAWIAEAVRRHRASGDATRIEIVDGRAAELTARLERGRIDAALSVVRDAGDALFEEGYGLALATTHRLAGAVQARAEEVGGDAMIVRRHCEALAATSRHFTARGFRPFIAARTDEDARALRLVAAGLGVTVMPDCFAAPGVARLRFAGFEARRRIGLVRGPIDSAALDGIAATIAELAAR